MEYELGVRLDIVSNRIEELEKKMDLLLEAAQVPEPKKAKKNG